MQALSELVQVFAADRLICRLPDRAVAMRIGLDSREFPFALPLLVPQQSSQRTVWP